MQCSSALRFTADLLRITPSIPAQSRHSRAVLVPNLEFTSVECQALDCELLITATRVFVYATGWRAEPMAAQRAYSQREKA